MKKVISSLAVVLIAVGLAGCSEGAGTDGPTAQDLADTAREKSDELDLLLPRDFRAMLPLYFSRWEQSQVEAGHLPGKRERLRNWIRFADQILQTTATYRSIVERNLFEESYRLGHQLNK